MILSLEHGIEQFTRSDLGKLNTMLYGFSKVERSGFKMVWVYLSICFRFLLITILFLWLWFYS